MVYSRDWFHPGPALVERLAGIPTLVAWKDGQGDIRRLQALMHAVGSRLTWVGGAGDDLVPAYYAAGIRAFTSSVWNVAPRLSQDLHERASRGDTPALAGPMSELIVPLYALRATRRGYEVTVMKALMDALGLRGGRVRPPLAEIAPEASRARSARGRILAIPVKIWTQRGTRARTKTGAPGDWRAPDFQIPKFPNFQIDYVTICAMTSRLMSIFIRRRAFVM